MLAGVANPAACSWRNAVYDIAGMVVAGASSATPIYIGCFADSEGDFGDDITLGGETYADSGYGLTFDGAGDFAILGALHASTQ